MDDNPETVNMSLLAIGRQNYGLDPENAEYNTSSNSHCLHGLENNDSFKVLSGMDGGDFYHSSGSCNHYEPSEMQLRMGIGPLMRQNCMSLIPSQSDSHNFPQTLSEDSRRSVFDVEQNSGQCSESGFLFLSDKTNQGVLQPDFEFCCSGPSTQSDGSNSRWIFDGLSHMGDASTTGNNLQEDMQGDCSGFAGLHSFGDRRGDACLRTASYLNGSCLDGQHSGSSMAEMSKNENFEFQNTSSKCNDSGHQSLNMRSNMDWNCDVTAGEVNLLSGALLSTQSSSLSGSVKREIPFLNGESTAVDDFGENSSTRLVQSNSGRSFKRKSSTAGITSSFPFHRHSSARRERLSQLNSRAALDRPVVLNQHCAGTNFSHTSNLASMTQAWENPQNPRGIMIGGDNGNVSEFLRGNSETIEPFSGINEQCQRSNQTRSLIAQPEQSFPLLHAPYSSGTGRSIPNSLQHQRRPRHIPSGQQQLESGNINISNSVTMHESDRRPASMISHRSSHLLTGSWSSNPSMLNGNYHHTGTAVAQRVPSLYEAGQLRTASWTADATTNNCFIGHPGLDPHNRPFTSSTTRARNGLDQHLHTYHTGGRSLIHAGSTSRSHFSSAALTGHNRTNIATPTLASGSNFSSPGLMPAQVVSTYQGSSYSATRPSTYGDNIVVSHIQSLLGVPFLGLRMLPSGSENRNNRVLSEELMMLDPSIVFGSINMVDQHRDMRLDVDNMSYEELLALEERIGNVCTGLSEEMIERCLKRCKHVDLDVPANAVSQESEVKCCICQEEYVTDDELGTLECSHSYHIPCIKQWLVLKNQCPICKAAPSAKS